MKKGDIRPCKKCGSLERTKDQKCKSCRKKYEAEWYERNKEKKIEDSKIWYENNQRRKLDVAKKWCKEHREYRRVATATYAKAHPEVSRVRSARRRAMKHKASGSFIKKDIKAMLKRQKEKCVVCKIDISNNYHIDHIMPLILGGSNEVSNIQLLCPTCNLNKGAKHPREFMAEKGLSYNASHKD